MPRKAIISGSSASGSAPSNAAGSSPQRLRCATNDPCRSARDAVVGLTTDVATAVLTVARLRASATPTGICAGSDRPRLSPPGARRRLPTSGLWVTVSEAVADGTRDRVPDLSGEAVGRTDTVSERDGPFVVDSELLGVCINVRDALNVEVGARDAVREPRVIDGVADDVSVTRTKPLMDSAHGSGDTRRSKTRAPGLSTRFTSMC
mmetsp:Transcript_43061/g.133070  ORF Transcript_43061/g.133070 Transcript_43061/m.133070 type:complete len:206 (-) Transcript_43061:429-1046(-)